MKEAKDEIDSSFRETMGPRNLQPEKKESRRKRSRQPDQQEESEGSESSAHEDFLEPTPLAVQDAAYADEIDDEIGDLGFRIGRMRLGERIGGHYRPRIADEVYENDYRSSLQIANCCHSRSCLLYSIFQRGVLHQFLRLYLLSRPMSYQTPDRPIRPLRLTLSSASLLCKPLC